jgi:hypothetical protein
MSFSRALFFFRFLRNADELHTRWPAGVASLAIRTLGRIATTFPGGDAELREADWTNRCD